MNCYDSGEFVDDGRGVWLEEEANQETSGGGRGDQKRCLNMLWCFEVHCMRAYLLLLLFCEGYRKIRYAFPYPVPSCLRAVTPFLLVYPVFISHGK